MKSLSFYTRRLHNLSRLIEKPHLVRLRRDGVQLDLYEALTKPWLRSMEIATVIDIGANVGQFSRTAHAAFPAAMIYAFEPLPDCYRELLSRMTEADRFQAFQLGLGSSPGELEFQANAFAASSSFLKMADSHKQAFPHTTNSKPITVKVECLDMIAKTLKIDEPLLIKIDVQGFEHHVLRGGEQTVKRAKVVITETSFQTLYEGQPLFQDVQALLSGWGFTYSGMLDQMCDPRSGRPLQSDSIFVKG